MLLRIFRAMLNETDTFFKMLADSTRIRCLMLMQAEGELCVCELTHALNLSQPKISRHLAHLREAGVLIARRNGTWMNYRINPELDDWALNILQTTLDGVRSTEPFMSDRKSSTQGPNGSAVHCLKSSRPVSRPMVKIHVPLP